VHLLQVKVAVDENVTGQRIEKVDILERMQRNTGSPTRDMVRKVDELEGLCELSIEYLMIHLLFEKGASPDLLLLFLQKAPSSVEDLLTAIRNDNMTEVQHILENGTPRTPLPTKDHYKQIIDAVVAETNKELATNLLRYLLFFPMKGTHETAIPYLIERYGKATDFTKRQLINPCCWAASTIFLAGDMPTNTASNISGKMSVQRNSGIQMTSARPAV